MSSPTVPRSPEAPGRPGPAEVFVHPRALVESAEIGRGTRIWAFVHVLPGAVLGEDCNLCDHVFVENDVVVGDRVTIKSGVQLWDGVTLEDDVFIGPNATFSNDPFPRSKQYREEAARTVVKRGASVGANATLLPGTVIGENAMVGAGSVVTREVPRNAVVVGNPARITGYADTPRRAPASKVAPPDTPGITALAVGNARLHRLPRVDDLRGALSFAEIGQSLPFAPKRYFMVYDVPNREIRGEHAHRTLQQFLVCVRGSCAVTLDDGGSREELVLDSPTLGLYLPPFVWSVQYRYSADALLLVFASDVYDAADYIRDYDEFLSLVRVDGR